MLHFAQNSQIDFSTGSQMPNTISNQTNEPKVQNTNFCKAQTKERTTKQIYSTNTNPKVPAQTKQIPIVVAQLESKPNN